MGLGAPWRLAASLCWPDTTNATTLTTAAVSNKAHTETTWTLAGEGLCGGSERLAIVYVGVFVTEDRMQWTGAVVAGKAVAQGPSSD